MKLRDDSIVICAAHGNSRQSVDSYPHSNLILAVPLEMFALSSGLYDQL